MDNINFSSDVEYETNDNKKKFKITRGMVILAAIILVVLIIVIVIIVSNINKNRKNEYTIEDFNKLESRMSEEAPNYILQKQMVLTETEVKIDLKDLLVENGGFIDSSKVKAVKICDGYVIASKTDTENYLPYIKCDDKYMTSGYVSNNSSSDVTTTTKSKDTTPPTITLIGDSEITINVNSSFNDPGAKANDNIDGDITSKIIRTGNVDINKVGTYTITYSVTDSSSNTSSIKRTINVISVPIAETTTTKKVTTTKKATTTNTTKKTTTTKKIVASPTITLYGNKTISMSVGDTYKDPGYTAFDALGNNITSHVNVSGNVNTKASGTYYLTYSVTDSYGNKTSTTRTIVVKTKNIALSGITLSPNTVEMSVGQSKTLTVYYTPTNATNKSISWSSDTPSVAMVSNGVIYAKSRGTAIITVKSSNGKTATARITVK